MLLIDKIKLIYSQFTQRNNDAETIDYKSETGITIGLIDSIISICTVLKDRDMSDPAIMEALEDLRSDADVLSIMG